MVEALDQLAEQTDIPRARLIRHAVRDSLHRQTRNLDQSSREQYQ